MKRWKSTLKREKARKLNDKEANTLSPQTNCIPYNSVTKINKPNELRIVCHAVAKFLKTSLIQRLLKGL